MSLFDINEVKINKSSYTPKKGDKLIKASKNNNLKTLTRIGKINDTLKQCIGDINHNQCIHYVTKGQWSMHNLLFYVLDITGPADVYFSTWSVSEDAVRQLVDYTNNDKIEHLYGVFDWRVKIRRPKAFELIKSGVVDLRLTSCHAKVTVIQNENWDVNIVSSANYTNNPRIEAGVLSTDSVSTEFHKKWLLDELSHSKPFGED